MTGSEYGVEHAKHYGRGQRGKIRPVQSALGYIFGHGEVFAEGRYTPKMKVLCYCRDDTLRGRLMMDVREYLTWEQISMLTMSS